MSDLLSDAHLAVWGRGQGLPPVLDFGREPRVACPPVMSLTSE